MADDTYPHVNLRDLSDQPCVYEIKRPMAWSPEDEKDPQEIAVVRCLDKWIMPVVTTLFL
jgi:hypothetical protein